MSKWLGDFPEDFTTVPVPISTNDGAGGAVAPSSAFETSDFKIFKNGSDVEKTSTNGLSIGSPFNGTTGAHMLVIDTSNDTGDSGFWVAGAVYSVALAPDETVDGQTVFAWVGQFSLGMVHRADVRQANGTDLVRTLQAGGTTTIQLAASEPTVDDALNNWRLWTATGTGASQFLRITDYVGSTRTATVVVDSTGGTPQATDGTTTYLLYEPGGTGGGGGLDAAGVRAAVGLASANLDTQLGDLPTNAELAAALAAADDATLTAIGTRASQASVDAIEAALPADPADASDIAALIATVNSALASLSTAVGNVPAGVLTAAQATPIRADLRLILGVLAGVTAFERAARGMTVGTVGSGSTPTSIVTSSLSPTASANDQFKGKIVTFAGDTTTAALRGQSTDITANNASGVLTVTALTTAPQSGDTFTIS